MGPAIQYRIGILLLGSHLRRGDYRVFKQDQKASTHREEKTSLLARESQERLGRGVQALEVKEIFPKSFILILETQSSIKWPTPHTRNPKVDLC